MKFKQIIRHSILIKNPILESYSYSLLPENNFTSQIIGYPLNIKPPTHKPFIFSCFALSNDGKLYYPDFPSGFGIAKFNSSASKLERYADLFTLMLARSVSDLIIVGVNSLNNELGNYTPHISIPKLRTLRSNNNKPVNPTTLVMCHTLDNIDFNHKLFINKDYPVIICCTDEKVNFNKLPYSFKSLNIDNLVNKNQLSNKNLIIVKDTTILVKKLYEIGFQVILNESPFSHHQFLELKILDEIWLNYSASYIGGNAGSLGQTQQAFSHANHPDFEILSLHSLGYNFLYSRQRVIFM